MRAERALFSVDRKLRHAAALENPISFALRRALGLDPHISLSNGPQINLLKSDWPVALKLVELASLGAEIRLEPSEPNLATWAVDLRRRTLKVPQGIYFALDSVDPGIFAETFIFLTHNVIPDLSKFTVYDVGAFVGDTALYFASRGARVIALEPDPRNYGWLRTNLALNERLSAGVETFNVAAGKSGVVGFEARGHGGSSTSATSTAISVQSVSLAGILDLAKSRPPRLLKLDCKGCEWELTEQLELSQFDALAIEYDTRLSNGETLEGLATTVKERGFASLQLMKHNYDLVGLGTHGTLIATRGG